MVINPRIHICCAVLWACVLVPLSGRFPCDRLALAAEPVVQVEGISLIPESLPHAEWKFYSGKQDATVGQTWGIQVDPETSEPMIVCKGEPYGYLQTVRRYRDFQLSLEWRYPNDANGNSGILLYTSGEDRIWPACVQVQLHHSELGSIFPHPGAKSDNEIRNSVPLARPPAQWNQCTIHSCNGELTVTINGEKVGSVSGCTPHEGCIALQSEGSEIHFRRIVIREYESEQRISRNSMRRTRVRPR